MLICFLFFISFSATSFINFLHLEQLIGKVGFVAINSFIVQLAEHCTDIAACRGGRWLESRLSIIFFQTSTSHFLTLIG